MKKRITAFLVIVLVMMLITDNSLAVVHKADAPIDTAGLKWKIKLGEGYANAPTYPLVSGNYLYVCTNDKLFKLNKDTGAVVAKTTLAGKNSFALIPPAEDEKSIYVPIGSGRIQALEKTSLKSKWISKKSFNGTDINGQTITQITYRNGNIYTGTWGDGGQYFCIDANSADGDIKWVYNDPNGFYWAGAYVNEDYIVFGSDSVDDKSKEKSQIICLDNRTGEIRSTMSALGSVRGPIESDESGNLYAATKGKMLYKFSLEDNGNLIKEGEILISGESTGGVTAYKGKIYVGTSRARIDVIDGETMTQEYYITVPGYPQGGVLITERSDLKSYLYATYNLQPGGISIAELGGNNAKVYNNFFIPVDKQSGISSITMDERSGTLYYKNDSGYLMAVDSAENAYCPTVSVKTKSYNSLTISWAKIANATGYNLYRADSKNGRYSLIKNCNAGSTSYTDVKLKTGKKYYYKLQAKFKGVKGTTVLGKVSSVSNGKAILSKPKIKTKKKKKAVKITWNPVKGASGYVIYRSTKKKGKYKKVKTVKKGSTKSWVNKKLKSKKKYYYKIRAYRKVSDKKVYSVYSNISYKKTK